MESAVVQQFGHGIFENVADHIFEHHMGQEREHSPSMMRLVVKSTSIYNSRHMTKYVHIYDISSELAIK